MKTKWLITICMVAVAALTGMSFKPSDESPFKPVGSIAIEAKYINTDNLGNLYVVSKTNQLYKYSRDGKLLSTLNYAYIGNITQVDATNPLEVYVFYKELNRVVFLDNNLAFRGEMNLSDIGIGQASAIARAYDNGLWVFDLSDLQLKKLNKSGEVLQMSGNVRQYDVKQNANPTYLHDNNDRVFMVDSVNGILLFDVFASYVKTIPVKGMAEIKVIDDAFYYYSDNSLHQYMLRTAQQAEVKLPDSTAIRAVSIEKERLYLLQPNAVNIFAYQ